MIEFSSLEVGNKFFMSRPNDETPNEVFAHKKTESHKDNKGFWANATNAVGQRQFIKYDQKVWIRL